VSGLQITYKD